MTNFDELHNLASASLLPRRENSALEAALEEFRARPHFPFIRRIANDLVVVGSGQTGRAGITVGIGWTMIPYARISEMPKATIVDQVTLRLPDTTLIVHLLRAHCGAVLRYWAYQQIAGRKGDIPGQRWRIQLDDTQAGWHPKADDDTP